MISWIQKYFQRHFRLVFALVLLAMAVPLVVIYSQSSGIGRAGSRILERPYFGHNLGNEAEAARIFRDGSLSAQLRGAYQASSSQLQQYGLSRVAGLALADELKIPQPAQEQIVGFIATLPIFKDEQGNFDQKRYTLFADSLKTNAQVTTADANRVLRDDTRLEQLGKLLGGPGYVLPGDIRVQLIRSDSIWSVAVASVDYTTFDAGGGVTEDALKKYFEENSFRYEVPPRARLSLVEFKAAEFPPLGAPTEQQLRDYYNANPARFPAPADESKPDAVKPALSLAPTTVPATDNFPKVRAQVEAALRAEVAQRAAAKAANDFTIALYERKAAANSPELSAFLAAQKRIATAVPAFAPDAPPAARTWLGNYSEQVDRLDKSRFFSDPLPTPDGIAVLLWNETLPSYKPLISEVHEKLATDFKDAEKRKRFVEHGKVLRATLESAVKAGTPFEKAAVAEKLEVKSYAGFKLSQPPPDLPYAAYSTLQGLDSGRIAAMVSAADKGYLVCCLEKKQPDLSPANARYAELRTQLMQFTAAANESSYLGALVEQELKKSEPAAKP